jgi:hypothetical protein
VEQHTYVALVAVADDSDFCTVIVTAPSIQKAIRGVGEVMNTTVDPVFDKPRPFEILKISREDVKDTWE